MTLIRSSLPPEPTVPFGLFCELLEDFQYVIRELDRHARYKAASTVAIMSRELTTYQLKASLIDTAETRHAAE